MFIVGRVVAGISVACLTPSTIDIIAHLVPKHRRPLFMGSVFACAGVSSTLGPILGGIFAQAPDWRWMFFINLPIGGAVTLGLFFFLPRWPPRGKGTSLSRKVRHLDPLGSTMLMASLTAFFMALQYGSSTNSWNSTPTIVSFSLFGGILVAFIIWQTVGTGVDKLIPRCVATTKTVWAASTLAMLINAGINTHVFLLPYFYQVGRDLN
jgi:MFS transporter, DHA2 family, glioxin efflux transporter